jgi:hypothetical protein
MCARLSGGVSHGMLREEPPRLTLLHAHLRRVWYDARMTAVNRACGQGAQQAGEAFSTIQAAAGGDGPGSRIPDRPARTRPKPTRVPVQVWHQGLRRLTPAGAPASRSA